MPFKFEITSVKCFANAKLAVISGNLLSGKITANSTAYLVTNSGLTSTLKIKGILNEDFEKSSKVSVTVSLWQPSAKSAEVGDKVVSHIE